MTSADIWTNPNRVTETAEMKNRIGLATIHWLMTLDLSLKT